MNTSNITVSPLPSQVNVDRSRTKLGLLLKEDRLIHEYHVHDNGIDVSLELRVEKRASACTGSAQLRSVEKSDYNADGTLSYPFEIKNWLDKVIRSVEAEYFSQQQKVEWCRHMTLL